MSSLGAFIKEVSNNSLIVDDSIDNIFNNDYKGSLIIKDTDVDLIGYIILYIAIHKELPVLGNVNHIILVTDSSDKAFNSIYNIYKDNDYLKDKITDIGYKDSLLVPSIYIEVDSYVLFIKLYDTDGYRKHTSIEGKRPNLLLVDNYCVGDCTEVNSLVNRDKLNSVKEDSYLDNIRSKSLYFNKEESNNMIFNYIKNNKNFKVVNVSNIVRLSSIVNKDAI